MESKKTIIKSLSKKHDADFDIKFKLWNDFTVSKGRLAEDKEIIKYNDNDYEHFYIGNWQKRQMSRWFTNVTKKPMNIVEKKLFLTNPFFKEWTQKKSLNQKIKFKLWNAYTNEIKKLVTDSKIIYDKIYGNFNIGKWQTIEQIKWIYFNNSINEKHKNALLNNKYFKQWTDTVKIAEDADYLFYIDPKLSKYTHIDIYNHIDKIYKLIIQHFNNCGIGFPHNQNDNEYNQYFHQISHLNYNDIFNIIINSQYNNFYFNFINIFNKFDKINDLKYDKIQELITLINNRISQYQSEITKLKENIITITKKLNVTNYLMINNIVIIYPKNYDIFNNLDFYNYSLIVLQERLKLFQLSLLTITKIIKKYPQSQYEQTDQNYINKEFIGKGYIKNIYQTKNKNINKYKYKIKFK